MKSLFTRRDVIRTILSAMLFACGIVCGLHAVGCSTRNPEPVSDYSWHGPLTDGTNGIVQAPKW